MDYQNGYLPYPTLALVPIDAVVDEEEPGEFLEHRFVVGCVVARNPAQLNRIMSRNALEFIELTFLAMPMRSRTFRRTLASIWPVWAALSRTKPAMEFWSIQSDPPSRSIQ
jgi:hypothetical protein